MKLLVATTCTQGHRASDFTWCVPGELVRLGLVCTRDQINPDDPNACGCAHAFIGLNSHKATTTAEVRDIDLSEADLVEAVRSSLQQSGWPTTHAEDVADDLVKVAEGFPVGAVVERRLDDVQPREGSPA